jgi:hypothetical protein
MRYSTPIATRNPEQAMNNIINSLKPGQSVKISGDANCWVQVERSGNGKTLRFVRCTASTQTVFKACAF